VGSPSPETLGVAELLDRLELAIASAMPGAVWVRGEVSGFRRTSRGAAFFRLVDTDSADHVIDVAARGRVMTDIDLALQRAGVGSLRSGIEIRAQGTVGIASSRSQVRLSLLDIDPTFTVGRLAVDREEVLRRLAADGTLNANEQLALPVAPMRVGLVTSRGSAAHADFLDQLKRSGYRFRVSTVHAAMQGERAPAEVARALRRLAVEPIDLVALVRGGGSKLDLMSFDSEEVGRAVSAMPVPVLSGIGHETDRSVVDEAAAVAVKTPSAAGEWIVARVADYAGRVDRARVAIRDRARDAGRRSFSELANVASLVGSTRNAVERHRERLSTVGAGVAEGARRGLKSHHTLVASLGETLSAVGVEPTLRRGFALVSREDGRPAVRAASLSPGERVRVRFTDGTVEMRVEGEG
jgi:exodeoxyribonuclease VII large subunit